jgi:uncharacterized membrane protein HdeD (DUF308 family)
MPTETEISGVKRVEPPPMSPQAQAESISDVSYARPNVRREPGSFGWGVPMTLGVLLIIGGMFALSAAVFTSLVSVIYLGALLVIVGVVEVVSAIRSRDRQPWVVFVLAGVLSVVVGGLFLYKPLAGLASVTLLIAGFFFASGLFRGITAISQRYPRWGWDVAYGVIAIGLGLYVAASFPISALWVLGTVVAIEIIARGISLVSAAWVLRDVEHRGPRGQLQPA